jgi:pimeloyl-ACP methyl ester carboxylesterase
MKARRILRALAGVMLCGLGFWLALATPYRPQTVLTDTDSCGMAVDIIEPRADVPQGSVVLLHGLSANKKIMEYVAQAFSEQGLRVFVPDLPGHGRSSGPFSPVRAEACTESFLRELIAHHVLTPERTILAGHSMGGAIAIRIASRIPVVGAVAISPAPMSMAQVLPREMVPFENPPPIPPNTLIVSASWEPRAVRDAARDLFTRDAATTGKYQVIPHTTHVSLLFDREALRTSQDWAAQVLHLEGSARLPSRWPLLGFTLGFGGLILLTAPFLREVFGKSAVPESILPTRIARVLIEVILSSVLAVFLLRTNNFLRVLHVFEGDYLAGFLLIVGLLLMLLHHGDVRPALRPSPAPAQFRRILVAAFSGLVILFLFSGWIDLTFSAAWLNAARWLRFPAFFAAFLPYHLAEELFAGPIDSRGPLQRLTLTLSLRLIAWAALLAGIFVLHSGEVLLILLAPYFGLFCLLQRLSMDVVRKETGSATAAAAFGAILMTGFSLAIFPIA